MPTQQILISVIIPIYKVERFLCECLDSVLGSSYRNLELILVDDGSPDGSPRICDEYAARDGRVRVIHKSNGGAGEARNCGVRAATGEYVVFVDGDDYWGDSGALEAAVEELERRKDIDLLCFDCATLSDSGALSVRAPYDVERVNGRSKAEVLEYFVGENRLMVTPWSKIVRRGLLLDNNIDFRCGIRSEDYDWTLQILLHSRVICAFERNFYVYRVWSGSVTSNISRSHVFDILSIVEQWSERIPRDVESTQEMNLMFDILAYIYGVLLSLVYIAPEEELLRRVKSQVHLLGCSRNRKVWAVALLYRILGFGGCWRVLGLFRRVRRV
ncbi:MAG: glycosyltransferase [Rikenellaceae bacterium]